MSFGPFDVIVYHGNCSDGITSAVVASSRWPTAECVAGHHGQLLDEDTLNGKRVLMVDFCPSVSELESLLDVVTSIYVLDHHVDAYDRTAGVEHEKLTLHFDMDMSGCGLMWQMAFPKDEVPPVVKYVEDRDLWRFAYPETKAYCAFKDTHPLTIAGFKAHQVYELANGVEACIERGEAVLSYKRQLSSSIYVNAEKGVTPGGQTVWVVDCPRLMASMVGNELAASTMDPCVLFCYENGGWRCSVRSSGHHTNTALEIAREFGGGGHKNAAGFRSDQCPMDWT